MFFLVTFTGTRRLNDKRPDVSCEGAGGLSGLRSLSANTNIALRDGSVRSVNRSVDLKVWKLLAGRADGEVLPGF